MRTRNQNAENFGRLPEILDLIVPASPYGVMEKSGMTLVSDRQRLETEFDLVAEMIRFIEESPGEADKVEYHIARLPHFSVPEESLIDQFLLFSVKKFLLNWKGSGGLLPGSLIERVGARVDSAELLRRRELGGDGESFAIGDRFDPRLPEIRGRIGEIESAMGRIRARTAAEIVKRYGIDLTTADAVTIPGGSAAGLSPELLSVGPYDDHAVTVRIRYPREWFPLADERDLWVRREREVEAEVTASLASAVWEERERIAAAMAAAGRVDWMLARARFSLAHRCSLPRFSDRGMILEEGRFLPLLWECERGGREYQAPSFAFGKKVNVIRGCNMGGKTVLLKTICFFQHLAQYGIPVPARSFETSVFDAVFTAAKGEPEGGAAGRGQKGEGSFAGGLSGFGREIREVTDAFRMPGRTLYLMDEFASTTGSVEGEALAGAIITELARGDGFLFFVTHFVHLAELVDGEIGWYRMRGFDRKRYDRILEQHGRGGDTIAAINRAMEYTLVSEEPTGAARGSDALEIAGLLGLPGEIVERAYGWLRPECHEDCKTGKGE